MATMSMAIIINVVIFIESYLINSGINLGERITASAGHTVTQYNKRRTWRQIALREKPTSPWAKKTRQA